MESRSVAAQPYIRELFRRNKIPNFDFDLFISSSAITIALAISGGGYRSLLIGAGILTAFDNRTPRNGANDTSLEFRLQGLYQGLSYIGGISGGSWLVISIYINDNIPLWKMQTNETEWRIDRTLLEGIPSVDSVLIQQKLPLMEKHVQQKEQNNEPENSWISCITGLFGQHALQKRDFTDLLLYKGNLVENLIQTMVTERKSGNSSNSTAAAILKSQKPGNNITPSSIFSYYAQLHSEVKAKRQAGYYISLTDYWGRALAANLFVAAKRDPAVTISTAVKNPSFVKYQQPFPIVASVSTNLTSSTSNSSFLMEFTPYEFGSWDKYLRAFVPIKYLGTSFYNGSSATPTEHTNTSICVLGYDTASFIMATSSSLFNRVLVFFYQFLSNTALKSYAAVEATLRLLGLGPELAHLKHPVFHLGQAVISPNPFYKYNNGYNDGRDSAFTESSDIFLVDGGDDGQNIPFQPFLIPERQVDVVLAYDISADTYGYPNGTTLNLSQKRYHNTNSTFELPFFRLPDDEAKRAVFPYVPSEKQLLEDGLNEKTLFLGCDIESDYPVIGTTEQPNRGLYRNSTHSNYIPPLIVYNPNTQLSYPANYSTFKLQYSHNEIYRAINNGFNLATRMNSSLYAVCLNCAFIKRHFDRASLDLHRPNFTIPKTCQFCYREFCWSRHQH